MPPVEIDGNPITGATIDGTDVQEITVDGDTVFTAETNPVAYSDLKAWFPFDSLFYGGSNADDVTAIFNSANSGDSTAYDATVNGPTHVLNGVVDVNNGASSGAYQFTANNNQDITIPLQSLGDPSNGYAISIWFNYDGSAGRAIDANSLGSSSDDFSFQQRGGPVIFVYYRGGTNLETGIINTNDWHHVVWQGTSSGIELYHNNVLVDSASDNHPTLNLAANFTLGNEPTRTIDFFGGRIDDVRLYDTALTSSQIDEIYQNTKP